MTAEVAPTADDGVATSTEDVEVLVIGAGITGIYQLYRALEAGFTARLLEAGTGVGGTWFWNRYPGARFDSESYTYGYLFSKDLFFEWAWTEQFAEQPEIERYLNHVVDRFDLRRHIRCTTRVTSASFQEATAAWLVAADAGTRYRARYLIAATGVLSMPYTPDVPGMESFRGEMYHTGRWPSTPVEFAGKRVAVVGTGSSGVQIIPVIASEAASLTVFQRTPNWCTPLNNASITPKSSSSCRDEFESIRATLNTSPAGFLHQPHDRATFDDTQEERRDFFEKMWRSPGFSKLISHYTDLLFDDEANAAWCEFVAEKIRTSVEDPETAAKLTPTDHRFGEKRPPFVTNYFETFNRPNVSLVDLSEHPIVAMTEAGFETSDATFDLDMVVWATGFDFGTGALFKMDVRGRGGVDLREHWADGPSTFLGLQTTDFPNFFFPGGPHAAAGNNPRYNGDQVDFITELLVCARERDCDTVEVDPDAEASWTAMVDRWAQKPPSFGQSSYYFGTNIPGKPRRYLLNSAGRPKFLAVVADVRAEGFAQFALSRSSAGSSATG